MAKIKDIIVSENEPSQKDNGWLLPNKDGKLELKFFGSKGWESVSKTTTGKDLNIYVLPYPQINDASDQIPNWTTEMLEEAIAVIDNGGIVCSSVDATTVSYVNLVKDEESIIGSVIFNLTLPRETVDQQLTETFIVAGYINFVHNPTTGITTILDSDMGAGSVQRGFKVGESLKYTIKDAEVEPDILDIKDGGVTLAKLAPDVSLAYIPPTIKLSSDPKKGDIIPDWTRDVWDNINASSSGTVDVDGTAYIVTRKYPDLLSCMCSYSTIVDNSIGSYCRMIEIVWDSRTNQSKISSILTLSGAVYLPLFLPTIVSLPENEEQIEEWSLEDFNACKNGLTGVPKIHYQVQIEGKLYTPIAFIDESDVEKILFGCVEMEVGGFIKTSAVTLRLGTLEGDKTDKVFLVSASSFIEARCFVKNISSNKVLVGFSGTVDDFEVEYGILPDVFFSIVGTVVVNAHWFNSDEVNALTAISCKESSGVRTSVFSDGTNIVTVSFDTEIDNVSITSTELLQKGSSPTIEEFNTLSAKIEDINSKLTALIGE